ncbi:di-N-acetylchitobiase-like isoform X2 [Podarcis raffonei]|uniref:di-N-acetylchitobiase-like isoform X2 n=1 Tax=Podarcis raffonei TaxID=65483 RepID=UPI0023296795|nr:di-N-acetylchitobiase-like isoform X2 [Podarcis raffonei]
MEPFPQRLPFHLWAESASHLPPRQPSTRDYIFSKRQRRKGAAAAARTHSRTQHAQLKHLIRRHGGVAKRRLRAPPGRAPPPPHLPPAAELRRVPVRGPRALQPHLRSQGLRGDISVKSIVDPAVRAAWIKEKVDLAKRQHLDGINIDIEQEVAKSSPEYYALTDLVKETTEAFHREIPGSQVTFDVAWSPDCIDKRCYNYTGIAESCDFVFVMSYDEQSQVWSECIARANAPYNHTIMEYEKYIHMGINPKKIVMGVPWYGYDYTCLGLIKAHVCSIAKVPFRGAPCSDAAGRQRPYKVIMDLVNSSISGILWDEEQEAPYLEYKDEHGVFHQVWFDNPRSISLKAAYVKKLGLRGIGMWNADCLNYSGGSLAQEQTAAMWAALIPK